MIFKNKYLMKLFGTRKSVAVLDDFFPDPLTAFRVAEYNFYLEQFPKLVIYSSSPHFEEAHATYAQTYPKYADRIKPYDKSSLEGCAFAYMNFLNNAHYFLEDLNSHHVPFLMTLYPGGGFGLGEPDSDAKLKLVLSSSLLRGIIATQNATIDYLEKMKCYVPVHDIYGGTMQTTYFDSTIASRRTPPNAALLNICFVAYRYMPQGENKGYPQFIAAATRLVREFPHLKFSVVGNFTPEDIPLSSDLHAALSFHGLMHTAELKEFFLTQHIIISPNRPNVLHPGNFDGFPTGSCAEASLCGVAVVCSDELKLNRYYSNGNDIVICDPTHEAVVDAASELIRDCALLESIGLRGQKKTYKLANPEIQLRQRSELLENYAIASGAKIRGKCRSGL